MKKILLLLAVCTVTTANAARPLTIMNETDNYYIYGHLTAKDGTNCSNNVTVSGLEFYPGDAPLELPNSTRLLGTFATHFDNYEITINGEEITSNFVTHSRNLFVNGTYEWSNLNFKAAHQSNNMLHNGAVLSFITGQACDNNIPYQWTGGNGTSIARAESYSIGEHMYMTFTEQ